MKAIREYSGKGTFLGCYVLEQGDDAPPTVVFRDPLRQAQAEIALEDFVPTPEFGWLDALEDMVAKQNYITILREGPFETDLTAEELAKAPTPSALA